MKIKLIKFNDNLIYPHRAHYNDAGIDCYALEDFELIPMHSPFMTHDNATKIVPLGFGLNLPDGYMATIRPRSSINLKGVHTYIGTIDSGYRGEIKCCMSNLTNKIVKIKRGERICQLIIEPVVLADFVDTLGNTRDQGGFGSTGR